MAPAEATDRSPFFPQAKGVPHVILRVLAGLFFFLGLMKMHGLLTTPARFSEWLDHANPLFPFVSNRGVLFVAAWLEMLVGGLAWSRRFPLVIRARALLWFACVLIGYQFLLVWVRYDGPCGCTFGINQQIPIPPVVQQILKDGVPPATILLAGALLLIHRRRRQRPAGASGAVSGSGTAD